MAMSMPGMPTTMKATRQVKYWAGPPPTTAPNMVPSGMPKE